MRTNLVCIWHSKLHDSDDVPLAWLPTLAFSCRLDELLGGIQKLNQNNAITSEPRLLPIRQRGREGLNPSNSVFKRSNVEPEPRKPQPQSLSREPRAQFKLHNLISLSPPLAAGTKHIQTAEPRLGTSRLGSAIKERDYVINATC